MAEGKAVAIVTGGERGIGRGIALDLLTRGYRVAIAGIDERAASETLSDLEDEGEVIFVHCDVGDEREAQSMVADVLAQWNRLDAVVCNAGIASPEMDAIEDVPLEEWEKVIRTNLTGCFLLAKHTAVHLRKSRGAMVLIASTRAQQSERDTFAYSASKGGIVALTHSLAISMGPQVRVNCISPGWIETRDYDSLREEDHSQHPAGRVGKPEDVAKMTAYLLGDDAGFVTGQNFILDGGMTRKMIYLD